MPIRVVTLANLINKVNLILNYILTIIINSCLTSNAVPIKVHTDYCRDVDTKNLQSKHEW